MRPTLITLIAAAVGVFGTLVFRDLLLAWFAGQSSNSLFAPWVLIEGVFVFVIALSLFFFVARCAKSHSSLLLLVAAIAYILGTLPTSVWWLYAVSCGTQHRQWLHPCGQRVPMIGG